MFFIHRNIKLKATVESLCTELSEIGSHQFKSCTVTLSHDYIFEMLGDQKQNQNRSSCGHTNIAIRLKFSRNHDETLAFHELRKNCLCQCHSFGIKSPDA